MDLHNNRVGIQISESAGAAVTNAVLENLVMLALDDGRLMTRPPAAGDAY